MKAEATTARWRALVMNAADEVDAVVQLLTRVHGAARVVRSLVELEMTGTRFRFASELRRAVELDLGTPTSPTKHVDCPDCRYSGPLSGHGRPHSEWECDRSTWMPELEVAT